MRMAGKRYKNTMAVATVAGEHGQWVTGANNTRRM